MSSDLGRFPPVDDAAPVSAPLGAAPETAARESEFPAPRFDWRTNLLLFLLTVASVFYVGQTWTATKGSHGLSLWTGAWTFAVPLMAILVTHEFGHYIAARIHRVPASLPYFLPLPFLNPFGTLGAVIIMPRRIRSANALLDIGAAGPLAGMAVAVPIMLYGLSLSTVGPREAAGYIQEGQSLLYWALKTAVFGPIPATHDVQLHPTALAAWAGFLVTFLNMIPFSQLDGGHVAYALFGRRQDRFARWVRWSPLVLAAYNFALFVLPVVMRGINQGFGSVEAAEWFPASSVTVWLTIFVLLTVMKRASGSDHPPVDDARLSPKRRVIAVLTLLMFVSIFMPSPWVVF